MTKGKEVDKLFRSLMQRVHPDRPDKVPPHQREWAEEMAKKLNAARNDIHTLKEYEEEINKKLDFPQGKSTTVGKESQKKRSIEKPVLRDHFDKDISNEQVYFWRKLEDCLERAHWWNRKEIHKEEKRKAAGEALEILTKYTLPDYLHNKFLNLIVASDTPDMARVLKLFLEDKPEFYFFNYPDLRSILRETLEHGTPDTMKVLLESNLIPALEFRASSELRSEALAEARRSSGFIQETLEPLAKRNDEDGIKIVEVLLYTGANIDNLGSNSILSWAVSNKRLKLTEFLLKKGKNVNGNADDRITPLQVAVKNESIDIAEFLLKSGAPPNSVSEFPSDYGNQSRIERRPPLIIAIEKGSFDMTNLLLDNGADINIGNGLPLRCAIETGVADAVQFLLDKGVDPSLEDGDGITALMCAVISNNIDIVKLLLDRGVDINYVSSNGDGDTALHKAVKTRYDRTNFNPDYDFPFETYRVDTKIAEVLLDYGADTDIKDNSGRTPEDCVTDSQYRSLRNNLQAERELRMLFKRSLWNKQHKQSAPKKLSAKDK